MFVKYVCNNCENVFDEPKRKLWHYCGSNLPPGGYYEEDYVCPFCGSDDFEEIGDEKIWIN